MEAILENIFRRYGSTPLPVKIAQLKDGGNSPV